MSENADTELAGLLERIEGNEYGERLGDGGNVYDLRRGESYMVAGGGPTAWVTFWLEHDGEIRSAELLHYFGGDESTAEVPDHLARPLLDGLRADRYAAEHGGSLDGYRGRWQR